MQTGSTGSPESGRPIRCAEPVRGDRPVSDPVDPILVSPNGRRRGRGFALPIPGIPGHCNAITDVAGVAVGFTTLIVDGETAVRTGVTAILPRSADELLDPVWAGSFSMNGNGEMT